MRYRIPKTNTCRAGCGDLTTSPDHAYCGRGGRVCQWLQPSQYAEAAGEDGPAHEPYTEDDTED